MSYQGKVVWITGASSGIGEALAHEFKREGARLVLSSNEPAELERVKKDLGGDVLVLPLDLSDLDSLPQKAAEAAAAFGPIDVLVNNGGISQRSSVIETSLATYQKLITIDFLSHVVITKAVLPAMLERQSGQIVVTSSVAGKIGAPQRAGYSAAKHALHGFFDTLRAEIADRGVKITLICPTAVTTKISLRSVAADGKEYGVMSDHLAKGLTPEAAAQKIMAAVRAGKNEVIIGFDSLRLAVYIKRFFPDLFVRLLAKAKTN